MASELDRIHQFQNTLIARATGGQFDGGYPAYRQFRQEMLADPILAHLAPAFISQCNDETQFWSWIKYERTTYQERRTLIWEAFRPLVAHFEAADRSGGDGSIS